MSAFLAAMAIGAAASDEIVVTARLPEAPQGKAYSVSRLSADDLAASGAVRLDDALRLVPGFQLFRRASSRVANPTAQGISLRALGGNASSRAAFLLDGVPQEEPFGGALPFSALTLTDIESVRILRGGGAVAAGNGALAGMIVVDSAMPDETGGKVQASFGRFNSFDVSGAVAYVRGAFSAQASGSVYDSDGYRLIIPAQRGSVDVPAASRARTVRVKLSYAFDALSSLHMTLARFDEDKLAGFANAPNANDGKDASLRYVRDGGDDSFSLDVATWIKQRDFSARFAAANAARTIATLTLDQFAVPGKGYGARAEMRAPKRGRLSLRFGADATWARGETRENFRAIAGVFTRERRAGGHSRILGGYGEASLDIAQDVLLTAGVRADHARLSKGKRQERDRATGAFILNRSEPVRRSTEWTGRAGLAWQVTPAITSRAAGYVGWRLPTLNELYRPFRVGNDVTEANAALRPERLTGVDLGLAYAPLDRLSLDVTLFWNQLDDAISNVTIGTGPGTFPDVGFLPAGGTFRQRNNVPSVRNLGLEVQAAVPLAAGLDLRLGYAFADAKVQDAGRFAGLQDKRLAQSARHQGNLQLRWADAGGRFGAYLTARGQSGLFDDDANTRRLPGFVTLDLGADVQLAEGWTLFGRLENATGELIQSAISGDGIITRAQPRAMSLGLKAAF